MDLERALAFARSRHQGVLLTTKADGRPQASNVLYAFDGEAAEVSVTEDRTKTRNLRRDPRGALYVAGDDFSTWVVLEARAELSAVAAHLEDQVVEGLVAQYRRAAGEHPDWEEFRRTMVEQRRVLLRLRPHHAYGILRT